METTFSYVVPSNKSQPLYIQSIREDLNTYISLQINEIPNQVDLSKIMATYEGLQWDWRLGEGTFIVFGKNIQEQKRELEWWQN